MSVTVTKLKDGEHFVCLWPNSQFYKSNVFEQWCFENLKSYSLIDVSNGIDPKTQRYRLYYRFVVYSEEDVTLIKIAHS